MWTYLLINRLSFFRSFSDANLCPGFGDALIS